PSVARCSPREESTKHAARPEPSAAELRWRTRIGPAGPFVMNAPFRGTASDSTTRGFGLEQSGIDEGLADLLDAGGWSKTAKITSALHACVPRRRVRLRSMARLARRATDRRAVDRLRVGSASPRSAHCGRHATGRALAWSADPACRAGQGCAAAPRAR